MQQHATMGEQLVIPIDVPLRVKQAIRQHQERWDGKGYPDGLKGEAINLFGRIIAVADTWDAMTSDRPYRRALMFEQALEQIRSCSGTHFDPEVVRGFVELCEDADKGRIFAGEGARHVS